MSVININCLHGMLMLPDNSVDAIVTDPPYGLSAQSSADIAECLRNWTAGDAYDHGKSGFMGRKWDSFVPGPEIWREALRVLKPGGHIVAFAGTRTQHLMALSLQLAGFEIRDMLAWIYGCLSEDSEILTEDGWMPYNNAKQKRILSYDVQNDIYQWEEPSRWYEYHVESDTAYRIQSDHSDQIVSRGHRCLVERCGKLTFVSADELSGVERMPYLQSDFSALPQGRGELLLETVLREGESVAEANVCEREGQAASRQRLASGEEPSMERRVNVLQAQGEVCRSVDKVRSVPAKHARHGAQGRLCDGAQTGGCHGDRQDADTSGVCASYQSRRDGQPAVELDVICEQCGSQTLRARASYQTTMATVSIVEYSGVLWCPTVSTGAFVARRNGLVFLTGNSGFPKSHDVSKAIDAAAGAEREVLDSYNRKGRSGGILGSETEITRNITAPAPDAARQWQGWGTALKPALEPITLARKPLMSLSTNVLEVVESQLRERGVLGEIIWKPESASAAGKRNRPNCSSSTGQPRAEGTFARSAAGNETPSGEQQIHSNLGTLGASGQNVSQNDLANSRENTTDASELKCSTLTAGSALAAENSSETSSLSITSMGEARSTERQCTERFTPSCDGSASLPGTECFVGIATGLTGSMGHVPIKRDADGLFIWPQGLPKRVSGSPLTVAANVLTHGTGAINIDGCRVATDDNLTARSKYADSANTFNASAAHRQQIEQPAGRFPANLLHDGSDEVVALFPDSKGSGGSVPNVKVTGYGDGIGTGKSEYHGGERKKVASGSGSAARFFNECGFEEEDFDAAQRAFYCAKASRADRNEGLDDPGPQFQHGTTLRKVENTQTRGNRHPTVKPTSLMQHIVRLVTPPGGVALDPFMGSGSTGKACMREGFGFIGCELKEEYFEIARARIQHEFDRRLKAESEEAAAPDQADLFGASSVVAMEQSSMFSAEAT